MYLLGYDQKQRTYDGGHPQDEEYEELEYENEEYPPQPGYQQPPPEYRTPSRMSNITPATTPSKMASKYSESMMRSPPRRFAPEPKRAEGCCTRCTNVFKTFTSSALDYTFLFLLGLLIFVRSIYHWEVSLQIYRDTDFQLRVFINSMSTIRLIHPFPSSPFSRPSS